MNVAIADAPYAQSDPYIISDGKGGAVIVWTEARSPLQADIYAQRVDRHGFLLWNTTPGASVCTAFFDQQLEEVIGDGLGGVIVAWQDFRHAQIGGEPPGYLSNEIYVQRIDSSGVPLWQENGVLVRSSSPILTYGVHLVADGFGGVYLVWQDFRDGDSGNPDVYAQHIDSQGQVLWQTDGIPVNRPEHIARGSAIVPDGEGGVLVFYTAKVGLENIPTGQRINSEGQFLWGQNTLRRTVGGTAVPDGSGGAILVGVDYDAIGNVLGLESQRINNLGIQLWGDGFRFGPADRLTFPFVTSDGSGGVLVSWTLLETTGQRFIQRMDSSGTVRWRVETLPGKDAVTSDLAGGAIVLYATESTRYPTRYYAQRIDSTGTILWPGDGVIFRLRDEFFPSGSGAPLRMTTDGSGGAIIVWDERPGLSAPSNVYAQQISRYGNLGEVITSVESETEEDHALRNYELSQNYPNPFNLETTITYTLSKGGDVTLDVVNLWGKVVRILVSGYHEGGSYRVKFQAIADSGKPLASGVYFYRLNTARAMDVKKLVIIR